MKNVSTERNRGVAEASNDAGDGNEPSVRRSSALRFGDGTSDSQSPASALPMLPRRILSDLRFTCVLLFLAAVPQSLLAATVSQKLPVVPKWERFEAEFTSLADYTNPLQEVTLKVQFTSPLGETTQVYGFWDGGRTWRVRFAPSQPGHWKFKSSCSDAANLGLNDQTGEFLCTSSLGKSPFYQHGPVRLATDRRHLQFADGTPFFWLADTVWNGAGVSEPKNWEIYAVVRSSQNYSAAQWAVVPGADSEGHSALTGFPERIGVNPDFFKSLDAKVATLAQVGMLSAIAPLLEAQSPAEAVALPDDQAVLLVRYVVARWGADPVAWVIQLDGGSKSVERWKKIGQEAFGGVPHAPVLVAAIKKSEALTEFRDQEWVDLLQFQGPTSQSDDDLRALGAAGGSENSRQGLIVMTPQENALGSTAGKRVNAEDVRQSAYRGLLAGHAAGITYAGHGVANWITTIDPKTEDKLGAGLPFWHKALFMPGAKQLGSLAALLDGINYWQLRPAPQLLAGTADAATSTGKAVAAETPAKDFALVYEINHRMLELSLEELPQAPSVTWFNPRRANNSPAVAVVVQRTCQFPAPDQSDWLLVIKAGK